jgi:hypothetical protein
MTLSHKQRRTLPEIARGDFPTTLFGLLQLAQTTIAQAWEEGNASADDTPCIIMAEADGRPSISVIEGDGSRPPDAGLVQMQARLAKDGYTRCAVIDAAPDGVQVTARDTAGNKLTAGARIKRDIDDGQSYLAWRKPVAETEDSVGLLWLPIGLVPLDTQH